MYNLLHLAASRGMNDAMRPRRARRPHPTVQPAGASHLTLIVTGPPAADAGERRLPAGTRPPSPWPSPHGT